MALHDWAEAVLGTRLFRFLRYLISGGTAAATNFTTFFLLVHFGHVYYLYASVIAFVVSVGVSFAMQKFWTFQDRPTHDMHAQFARYLVVILLNLLLNTTLVYLFVEYGGVWYLFSQMLATAVIAITGYVGYRYFVFRERVPLQMP